MNLCLFGNRAALIGKTNSGKSQLLKHMLDKEKHKFNKIFVISPTESVLKFYSKIVPENQIFSEYKDEWITDLMKKLTNYKKNNEKPYHVLLILDDVGSDCHNSKALAKIFTMGRHLNISIVMTMQYLNQCPPVCRTNFSFICCGQMNKLSTELLCDEYLMGCIDKKEFLDMYHNSTKDYHFFVINCNSVKDNENIDEIYGCIKAE